MSARLPEDWTIAHAALTHAGDLASKAGERADTAKDYHAAIVLHLLAAELHAEAIRVIGRPSLREVA